jgi:hypothetical protein
MPDTRRPVRVLFLLVILAGCQMFKPGPPPDQEKAEEAAEAAADEKTWSKEKKAVILNVGAGAAVILYGLEFWDYGASNSFKTKNEGWFGANTESGGADKLGHAYATYLTTLGFASLYEYWGFERERADLYGALSSFGCFTLVELGDGYSDYGFSYEDMIMDSAGIAFAYLRRRSPVIRDLLDFRIQYWPSEAFQSGGHTDIVTDYSGYKYLLALKLEGIKRLEPTPLSWVELHLGYFTRGYVTSDPEFIPEESRHLYFGVGLNLSRVFRKAGLKKVAPIFNFYQVPYTYWSTEGSGR